MNLQRRSGFTLIELVIVITLMGAIASMVTAVFAKPFEMYNDTSERVKLVSYADIIFNRIERDLRAAVPNSIRVANVGSIYIIELMHVESGGRYRYSDIPSDLNALTPSSPDASFDVLGHINAPNADSRIVVNPVLTQALYLAATVADAGFITPTTTTLSHATNTNTDRLTLSSAFLFDLVGLGSLRKRFYIMDTMVKYRCDPVSKTLTRYTDYDPAAVVSTIIPVGSTAGVVSDLVTDCEFIYAPGNSERNGLITLMIEVEGQYNMRLVKQVRVNNAP